VTCHTFHVILCGSRLTKCLLLQVLGAVDKLAKLNGLKTIQARELVNKLSHSVAFGSIDQWNANHLKRYVSILMILKYGNYPVPSHVLTFSVLVN